MSDTNPLPTPESMPELLAGYVLGDLTPTELAIVEAYLAAHPDRQTELASLMLPLDLLPLSLPADLPPASLRQKILDVATAETTAPANTLRITTDRSRQFPWWRAIGGLGVLLLGGLCWQNYRLSTELATVKQDLQTAIASNQKSQEEKFLASLIPQPNNRFIPLKNMQGKSGAGSLIVAPNKSVAVLVLQKVEPLPPGKVYRVWAIVGDKEFDCAHFVPDGDGKVSIKMPIDAWQKASKITITIEDKEAKEAEGEIAIEGAV